MNQAFNAGFKLNKRTIVGDVGDQAGEARVDRVFGLDAFPRVGKQLLHAQADALGFVVDADDLHFDRLADRQNIAGVANALPGNIGDVQKAVDAAQIDKCAIVGDVLDHAVDNLAFLEVGHQFLALLGPALFQHGAPRDHDVAAPLIHFQNLEGLGRVHQRGDVAHRAHIHLAAGHEGNGAVEIDGKAAFDAAKNDAGDFFIDREGFLQPGPAFLAPCLVAAQNRLAQGVFHPVEINFYLLANHEGGVLPRHGKFAHRDPAFGFQTNIDQRDIIFDRQHGASDHFALFQGGNIECFVEKRRKIFAAGVHCVCARLGHTGS